MGRFFLPVFCSILVFNACVKQNNEAITAFRVYCEMVANDAKPIAFHYPMEQKAIAVLWKDFEVIAQSFDVQLYREDHLPETLLFPSSATKDKEVIIIYKGNRLEQYSQWKDDVNQYKGNEWSILEEQARRLGRLLGYSPEGVNALMRKNSDYRDLASFGIQQQTTHLYYDDIEEAIDFYKNKLGLRQITETKFQVCNDGYIQVRPFDERYKKEHAKSTAIALLTNELPAWYNHINAMEIPVKYTYKPRDGGPHDGFVAIDPGGYLLEFEQFKQHSENELFMAVLANAPAITTKINDLQFYGTVTWTYHKDMLLMQHFYEEVWGYEMVADQGWTKIYQTSPSSFIGLVDERRGMQDYADEKAVELEWQISDYDTFQKHSDEFWKSYHFDESDKLIGPENYVYNIKATD